jgi:hypothetical protein
MFARVERSLSTAALIVAGAMMIAGPAQADTFWSADNLGSGISPKPVLTALPPDQLSNYGPFASYMYGSVIPRPNSRVVSFAYAPSGPADVHVASCQARFRSYDMATDSYLGVDGLRHRCELP